jgi:hypothetical protein
VLRAGDDEMTLSEMAMEIERRRIGTLPHGIGPRPDEEDYGYLYVRDVNNKAICFVGHDAAVVLLFGAMSMAMFWHACRDCDEVMDYLSTPPMNHEFPIERLFEKFCETFPAEEVNP